MTRGKSICSVLKTIRKQVADANHIKYEPRECHHEGECLGTCPACEAEVRYLERQLDLRRQLGKAVAIVGISAGLSALSAVPAYATTKQVSRNDSAKQERVLIAGQVAEPGSKVLTGIVEQSASFRGGNEKLMAFLRKNLRYPAEAKAAGLQGRVVVTFMVEKDGSISEPKVLKGVDPMLDKEALRVVRAMPKWLPGKQYGQAVRTKFVLPIWFRP